MGMVRKRFKNTSYITSGLVVKFVLIIVKFYGQRDFSFCVVPQLHNERQPLLKNWKFIVLKDAAAVSWMSYIHILNWKLFF